eukprot:CAMPEP_0194060266 /NCGR_PEP_ID=MMETSP0009_2-20130614/71332_1 /TAXON_ID=210454 /ORGANISM="Grammatophora oceanica, Strain CCMP 410" /LENGTH=33 /DNA_ID= /DNA_START= /DNA_END= /DNA_ORIENTATION=
MTYNDITKLMMQWMEALMVQKQELQKGYKGGSE